MGAWKKLNMWRCWSSRFGGPVLDWLVGHGTIGMLDAGWVKAVLMVGLRAPVCIVHCGGGVWDKSAGAVGKILGSSV